MNSSIPGRTRRLLLCTPFLSVFGSLVPTRIAVGFILGHSRVGQRFAEVSTAEFEGRLLTR